MGGALVSMSHVTADFLHVQGPQSDIQTELHLDIGPHVSFLSEVAEWQRWPGAGPTEAGLWVTLVKSLVQRTEPPTETLTAALRRIFFSVRSLKTLWAPSEYY